MLDVLLKLTLLIALGAAWRWLKPGGMDVETARRGVTAVVYYLLLPVLILQVMWQASVGWDSVRISIVAMLGIFFGLGLMTVLVKWRPLPPAIAGAVILAGGFPNAVFLGLPLLDATFGAWSRGIAIQYDMLACTPLLMTVGALIAAHYGVAAHGDMANIRREPVWRLLLNIPPLWAMLFALVLNVGGVPQPAILIPVMDSMSACVVPLMLLSIGMGLDWRMMLNEHRLWLVTIAVVQLLVSPLLVWQLGGIAGLQGETLSATVMVAATPCMVAGILICDRYRLESRVYASAVTVTTVISLVTLPFWLHVFMRE